MEIDPPVKQEEQNINEKDIYKAAETRDSSAFKAFYLTGAALQTPLSQKRRRPFPPPTLQVAASSGHPEVVKVLADIEESKSVVNREDEEGWVPLHSAFGIGNAEIGEAPLSKGNHHWKSNINREDLARADVNLKNNGGCAALQYSASKGRLKIAELLIPHGEKINSKDKVGCRPLHRAASTGSSELCELLIEEGVEVDAVHKAGETPLMYAVIFHNKGVALLLVRHGTDVDVEDKEGYAVLGQASDDFRAVLVDAVKAMLEG